MKWLESDIQFLKDHYDIMTAKEIALKLNRTKSSINQLAFKLKLFKYGKIELGKKYGRLTVKEADKKSKNDSKYICECDCPNKTIRSVRGSRLLKGTTISCGCYKTELKTCAPGEATYKHFYNINIWSSKDRNYEHKLTYKEYKNIVKQNCFHCNEIPPLKNVYYKKDGTRVPKKNGTTDVTASKHNVPVNGIDRKDNTKGYTLENSVACCTKCNTMKMEQTEQELIDQCLKILKHKKVIK